MSEFEENRAFMKSGFDLPERAQSSDQRRGLPPPPTEKTMDGNGEMIDLPPAERADLRQHDLYDCLCGRRSRRDFKSAPLTLKELSFLLWASQGVQSVIPAYKNTGTITLRPVPSAGGRHAFETYLAVNRVEGLQKGVYLYRPLAHKLALLYTADDLPDKLVYAYGGEHYREEAEWLGQAPVVFLWSCVPYRGEWRYHGEAHRLMLLDAGHVCQNLYLACEGIGLGACAIAGYVQSAADELLGLDGQEEYTIYLAAVGKRA